MFSIYRSSQQSLSTWSLAIWRLEAMLATIQAISSRTAVSFELSRVPSILHISLLLNMASIYFRFSATALERIQQISFRIDPHGWLSSAGTMSRNPFSKIASIWSLFPIEKLPRVRRAGVKIFIELLEKYVMMCFRISCSWAIHNIYLTAPRACHWLLPLIWVSVFYFF